MKIPVLPARFPEDQYEAFLSVPILIKNDVVGVINVQHKKPHVYPPRLINLLSTVGRQVGSAIETARLYKETRQRAKALEALTAVSHTITQDRYPEEIMQLIVNMTAQMMGSIICSIMLLDEKSQELRIVASQSLDPGYRDKPAVTVHGSISGRTVLTKKADADPRRAQRTVVSVPRFGDQTRTCVVVIGTDDVQRQSFGTYQCL